MVVATVSFSPALRRAVLWRNDWLRLLKASRLADFHWTADFTRCKIALKDPQLFTLGHRPLPHYHCLFKMRLGGCHPLLQILKNLASGSGKFAS